jgi:hypothetical protein
MGPFAYARRSLNNQSVYMKCILSSSAIISITFSVFRGLFLNIREVFRINYQKLLNLTVA